MSCLPPMKLMVNIPSIKMVMNGGWFVIAIPTLLGKLITHSMAILYSMLRSCLLFLQIITTSLFSLTGNHWWRREIIPFDGLNSYYEILNWYHYMGVSYYWYYSYVYIGFLKWCGKSYEHGFRAPLFLDTSKLCHEHVHYCHYHYCYYINHCVICPHIYI